MREKERDFPTCFMLVLHRNSIKQTKMLQDYCDKQSDLRNSV